MLMNGWYEQLPWYTSTLFDVVETIPTMLAVRAEFGAYTYPSNERVSSCVLGQLFFHLPKMRMIVHPLRQVWYGPR